MNIRSILSLKTSDQTLIQLIRYTFVGGAAFAFDFGVYALGIYILDMHYLLAAALGFLFGLTVNYTLSVFWVFSERKLSNPLAEFLIFTAIGLIGIGLTEILLYALVEFAGAGYIAARLITAVVVYLWNFFARKYGLFNKSPDTT